MPTTFSTPESKQKGINAKGKYPHKYFVNVDTFFVNKTHTDSKSISCSDIATQILLRLHFNFESPQKFAKKYT